MRIRSLLALLVVTALQAAAPAAEDSRLALPFSLKVTEEKLEPLPDYMGPKNPVDMDFPYCPVMIDGEYWITRARRKSARWPGRASRWPSTARTSTGGP